MKIDELRLGSTVGYKGDAGKYHVLGFPDWISETIRPIIIDRCPKQICSIDKIKPLIITEEYLISIGLKQIQTGFVGFGIKVKKKGDKWLYMLRPKHSTTSVTFTICEFEYIHQFENISLSIIGKHFD